MNIKLSEIRVVEVIMEEKKVVDEKPISQIATRAALGWTIFLILFYSIWNSNNISRIIVPIAFMGLFVCALNIPFGIIGGKIGRGWRKTERATWIGAIIGTILGSILTVFFIIWFLLDVIHLAQ